MKKKLIIAPHPDDEVLGAGGVIKKFSKEGHEVYVLVITRGTPKYYSDEKIQNVRNEALEAHKILGVRQTVFLDFHAPELDMTSNAEISKAISEYISKWKITDLFIPHRGDIHNDHRKVFEASLVAARPVGNFTVKAIYAYETLSETEWAAPFSDDAFIPNHFVNISETMSYKFEAMQCFKSQIRDFPSTRSLETIESLAKFRGSTVGFNRAEAFMTIRTIKS
ncbi:bacillithiol biosynthesis deacetylase BshB1 [Psychroflexus torquis ATCC 700755]|uniref:Bacillithiol biosynthesis deacetylase BshB1 n=1 Tax=Psychroflexus torquis (strain ATCC 700755 / CIP 106069 / ACAM 623) TaxID=313595 RepID=K4ID46_PSYTT|nr:PIG-L deacetylase family protein [Psychroflexus torquis]AFU68477.1 bacillithiol biosynthesis deacetylase BshB1 [Psychroflexus torquis ATCC 700755]